MHNHSTSARSTTTSAASAQIPAGDKADQQPVRNSGASRLRFQLYRRKVKQKKLPKGSIHSSGDTRSAKDRVRSAKDLVWQFFRLLYPTRWQIAGILGSLTVSTILGLLPPAGTKFIIDYGLTGRPVPPSVLAWFPSLAAPRYLLGVVVLLVTIVSIIRIGIHIWGRWYATKISKTIQLNIRRRVFEHAVRLPLHRVQEIRSGGVASTAATGLVGTDGEIDSTT